MEELLANLRLSVQKGLEEVRDLKSLDDLRVRWLGKKGQVTQLLKTLGTMAPEERRQFGAKVNEFRQQLEQKIEIARQTLESDLLEETFLIESIDTTLPGRSRLLGGLHPISHVLNNMKDIFLGMGFTIAEGPELEMDYYNFEALNIPANHPTKDEQDTFYINENFVLRTHTSPVQVRIMERQKPPIRIIAPGKVFRSDEVDATHTPVFHQLEGLVIDKGITMGDLKGTLETAAREIFGPQTHLRFRPSFFPFTEPSAEVDVTCHACGGLLEKVHECRVCKGSGWIEMLGCGMVHPKVLLMSGIDPAIYSGFAFGLGIDRIVSQVYGISDPRLYFENDMQFLQQFTS